MKGEVFAAFNKPELSIEVIGARLRGGTVEHFRSYGAYRGRPNPAFVAVQASSDDITEGGPVSITAGELARWSRELVATLPTAEGTGRLPIDTDVPVSTQPLLESTLRVIGTTANRRTAAAAFAHLAPSMGAVVTLRAGSIADGVQPTTLDIHVADIDGDGRYALLMDQPAVALGVDGESLARLINKGLNALRNRHSEKIST